MFYLRACFLILITATMLSACGGGDIQNSAATDTSQSGFEPKLPVPRAAAEITPVSTSSALASQAVNLQDAIAILKMIVGLEVNSSGQSVTAYQSYAADIDGNGKVELTDAITVLKRVVGLETQTANWLFFNQSGASAPVVSDKLKPGLAPDLTAYVTTSATTSNVGLVAVLRGDVVGSQFSYEWSLTSKPANSSAALTGGTAATPAFTADVVGSYGAALKISDGSSNTSSTTLTLTAAVLVLPGTPTIGAATPGDTTASIAFTPGSTEGQTVTYTASCTATGGTTGTGTGTASPVAVTGLTNGLTYSCTITPSSSVGTGTASSAVSVVPVVAVPSAPTIGAATAGSTTASISFTAASTGATATSFSASCTPTNGSAVTGTGSASPISMTGLTNGTSYSCAVKAVNAGGLSAASLAVTVTPLAATVAVTYSAPANFLTAVQRSYTAGTLVSVSAFTNRSRYMISDSATASSTSNYLTIGSTYSATTGYAVESATIPSQATYNSYLSKLVHVVADTSGYFRLDSHLHPNNSIDFDATDSNKLKFRNNFGKASSLYGYVTFSYDASTKLLQARKRYKYSYASSTATNGNAVYTPAWTEDTAFTAQNLYVNYTGGVYKLVAAEASPTPLYLFNSPIDLGIPSFMNPNAVAFVTNSPAPFMSKVSISSVEGTSGISSRVSSTYLNQVATAGSNATTKGYADAYLATIKTAVEAAGGKLRYSPEVYTAYRDAALATKLVSDSIADGAPGQNLVPYVYFTNEKDTAGVYHPFMIVVTYGNQASPNGLVDIPHPPGDGSGEYPASKVTRFSNLENYITMIPMKDYGLVTTVLDNASVITKNLWTDSKVTIAANVYTYADIADNGLLIDGSVMFPTYNNALVPSHLQGELSASGCHVGQGGGGPHCHSDGYQSGFGLALYNDSDYTNKTHPPLLGFGYDGIALFGIYRSPADSGMLGASTTLDAFGAHNHDSIGYHYHAHTVSDYKAELLSYTTTMHVLMKGAYIGNVTSIPFFRQNSEWSNNKYLGGK
jgi:hypothetical protein